MSETRAMRPPHEDVDGLRIPPHSIEAEQSVLGALLLSNDALDNIADRIAPGDFYAAAHADVFRGIRSLIVNGRPADVTTLAGVLDAEGRLEGIGGIGYLGALVQNVPTAANVVHYADIVRDKSVRRQIAALGVGISELGMSVGNRPAAELLDEAQRRAMDVGLDHAGPDAMAIGDLLPGVIARIEERSNEPTDRIPGITTGLPDLDVATLGLFPGDLVLVAGRPSMGKTTLAMQPAIAAARAGGTALVFSLEMSADALVERSIANQALIDRHALRTGRLTPDDWQRLAEVLGDLNGKRLFIDGSPRLSVERMRARARRIQRRFGLSIVVVDYVQLMDGEGSNANERISNISRGLKLLARELGVPVVALSQLSRKCEERTDKRPMMSDLRDSGALEQDADVIAFVYRDEIYHPQTAEPGIAEIIIGKNREGPLTTVRALFEGRYNRFASAPPAPRVRDRAPSSSRAQRELVGDE